MVIEFDMSMKYIQVQKKRVVDQETRRPSEATNRKIQMVKVFRCITAGDGEALTYFHQR